MNICLSIHLQMYNGMRNKIGFWGFQVVYIGILFTFFLDFRAKKGHYIPSNNITYLAVSMQMLKHPNSNYCSSSVFIL